MALFGSSPLVISLLATRYFSIGDGVIDVTHFLGFMAAVTASTHLFGTFALRGASIKPEEQSQEPIIIVTDADEENDLAIREEPSPSEDNEETSALLSATHKHPVAVVEIIPIQEPQHGSTLDLLKDGYFWILALIATIVFGSVSAYSLSSWDVTYNIIHHRARWSWPTLLPSFSHSPLTKTSLPLLQSQHKFSCSPLPTHLHVSS